MLKMLSIVRTNSPTSVRLRDGLGYISFCATPPNMLNFWDGAPSLISSIRAIPQTLDRTCRRFPGMDRAQAIALWVRGHRRWAGWLSPPLWQQGSPKEVVTVYLKEGLLSIVRTNSPTSVRLGDGLGYISVCVTPPNKLTFWDSAPSLISGIRSMPQTLDRMCGRSQEWTWHRLLLPCGTGAPPVGGLTSSSAVTTRSLERGCDFLFEGGLLSIVRINDPTSVRFGDGFEYISVWTTQPNRLTF